MRKRVVVAVCGAAALVVAPAIYFHFAPKSAAPETVEAPAAVAAAPAPVAAPVSAKLRPAAPAEHGAGVEVPQGPSAEQTHEEYVQQRTAQLTELGMSDDPKDLRVIEAELGNTDPEIRQAAVAATVQFGSTDAIPALRNAARLSDDPQEQVDILKAVEFLQLPPSQAGLGVAEPSN